MASAKSDFQSSEQTEKEPERLRWLKAATDRILEIEEQIKMSGLPKELSEDSDANSILKKSVLQRYQVALMEYSMLSVEDQLANQEIGKRIAEEYATLVSNFYSEKGVDYTASRGNKIINSFIDIFESEATEEDVSFAKGVVKLQEKDARSKSLFATSLYPFAESISYNRVPGMAENASESLNRYISLLEKMHATEDAGKQVIIEAQTLETAYAYDEYLTSKADLERKQERKIQPN